MDEQLVTLEPSQDLLENREGILHSPGEGEGKKWGKCMEMHLIHY